MPATREQVPSNGDLAARWEWVARSTTRDVIPDLPTRPPSFPTGSRFPSLAGQAPVSHTASITRILGSQQRTVVPDE